MKYLESGEAARLRVPRVLSGGACPETLTFGRDGASVSVTAEQVGATPLFWYVEADLSGLATGEWRCRELPEYVRILEKGKADVFYGKQKQE